MGVGLWCGRQPPLRLSLPFLPSSLSMAAASSSPSTHAYAADLLQPQPSMLVFSGGTAFNGVVEELKKVTTCVAHVLPVSDDGGSTAEIVRVLGGPAVGDIRSRCLRLSDERTSEALAVRRLLGHRLSLDPLQAKGEWYKIVEGEHILWNDVSRPYRETIRAFLVYFQNQILRRATENFCFGNGSIGNFFFAGARIFFQSLDAAIFLFSRVSQIPSDSLVLPVVCTNDRLTLGCELWNGTVIRGQNEISHPTSGAVEPINKVTVAMRLRRKKFERFLHDGAAMMYTSEISHGFTWSRFSTERSPFELGLEDFVRELNRQEGHQAQVQDIPVAEAVIHPYVDPVLWGKVLRWSDGT